MAAPVITGQYDDVAGRPRNISSLPEYTNQKTGFGEQSVAPNTPQIQGSAVYNLIPANFREFTAGSGSTDAADGFWRVQTGTSAGGYGAIQSFRSLNYKPGVGAMVRFTALFESNAASSWQGAGLISVGDELSFGYNGTAFGIWHRYGGKPEVRTIQVTGAASGSTDLTLTLNGTAYTIPLSNGGVNTNAWEIADWLNDSANQGVWGADNIDDTVIIIALSDGAKDGAYTFSHASATGTITQNTAGVTKTSTHIPQSTWNGSQMLGADDDQTLDPTKGNVYQIAYQWLGFGAIKFAIEDQESGAFINVHTIRYANANVTTSLGNPALRPGFYAVNLTNTTNLTVKMASVSAFAQGVPTKTRNPRAVEHTQSIGNSAETTILALRNRRSYNYLFNQVEIEPLQLSVANEGSKNVEIKVRASTDPGVELQYTNAGNNLVSDVATDSRTFSGGRLLAATVVAGGDSVQVDLRNLQITAPPQLVLLVTAFKSSGSAADVTATLTYYEDL